MEKKSYLEGMRDKVERLIAATNGVDDLGTAYIAGRLDAKLEELEKNAREGEQARRTERR